MSGAYDFGILPLSATAKGYFARVVEEDNRLPAVPDELWVRYAPNPEYVPSRRPGDVELALQSRNLIAPQSRDRLYPGGHPIVVIESNVFTTRLVPIGGVPLTAVDISDLRINLGVMLRKICSEAAPSFTRILG